MNDIVTTLSPSNSPSNSQPASQPTAVRQSASQSRSASQPVSHCQPVIHSTSQAGRQGGRQTGRGNTDRWKLRPVRQVSAAGCANGRFVVVGIPWVVERRDWRVDLGHVADVEPLGRLRTHSSIFHAARPRHVCPLHGDNARH